MRTRVVSAIIGRDLDNLYRPHGQPTHHFKLKMGKTIVFHDPTKQGWPHTFRSPWSCLVAILVMVWASDGIQVYESSSVVNRHHSTILWGRIQCYCSNYIICITGFGGFVAFLSVKSPLLLVNIQFVSTNNHENAGRDPLGVCSSKHVQSMLHHVTPLFSCFNSFHDFWVQHQAFLVQNHHGFAMSQV